MSTGFVMEADIPVQAWESSEPIDIRDLTLDELVRLFPGRIELVTTQQPGIVLEGAPILGFLLGLGEALNEVRQGAGMAPVRDLYDEFELIVRRSEGYLECERVPNGGVLRVPERDFRDVFASCCMRSLERMESRFAALGANTDFGRLRTTIEQLARPE